MPPTIMKSYGYRVITAENAAEALRRRFRR